jgi:hypothetical protein
LVVGDFVFFSHGVDVEMFAQMGGPAWGVHFDG